MKRSIFRIALFTLIIMVLFAAFIPAQVTHASALGSSTSAQIEAPARLCKIYIPITVGRKTKWVWSGVTGPCPRPKQ